MASTTRRLEVQKAVGYVLMTLVVIGLIYLVHWVITAEPRSRYPGIERMRGEWTPFAPSEAVASVLRAPDLTGYRVWEHRVGRIPSGSRWRTARWHVDHCPRAWRAA